MTSNATGTCQNCESPRPHKTISIDKDGRCSFCHRQVTPTTTVSACCGAEIEYMYGDKTKPRCTECGKRFIAPTHSPTETVSDLQEEVCT